MLPVFAAEHRAAGAVPTTVGAIAAVNQYLLHAVRSAGKPASGSCYCRSMGQTDGRSTVSWTLLHVRGAQCQ